MTITTKYPRDIQELIDSHEKYGTSREEMIRVAEEAINNIGLTRADQIKDMYGIYEIISLEQIIEDINNGEKSKEKATYKSNNHSKKRNPSEYDRLLQAKRKPYNSEERKKKEFNEYDRNMNTDKNILTFGFLFANSQHINLIDKWKSKPNEYDITPFKPFDNKGLILSELKDGTKIRLDNDAKGTLLDNSQYSYLLCLLDITISKLFKLKQYGKDDGDIIINTDKDTVGNDSCVSLKVRISKSELQNFPWYICNPKIMGKFINFLLKLKGIGFSVESPSGEILYQNVINYINQIPDKDNKKIIGAVEIRFGNEISKRYMKIENEYFSEYKFSDLKELSDSKKKYYLEIKQLIYIYGNTISSEVLFNHLNLMRSPKNSHSMTKVLKGLIGTKLNDIFINYDFKNKKIIVSKFDKNKK